MLPFIAFYNMLSVPNSANKPFWKMAKSPAAPWIQDIFANFQLCLFYSCDTQLHAIFEKKTGSTVFVWHSQRYKNVLRYLNKSLSFLNSTNDTATYEKS